jgi:hypothetical protein
MSSKMQELNFLVMKMIYESFGIEKLYDSFLEETTSILKVMKYKVPPSDTESAIGLVAHTDKNAITILCQNEVQGLEVQTKNGEWAQVMVPENAFTAIVGDAVKVNLFFFFESYFRQSFMWNDFVDLPLIIHINARLRLYANWCCRHGAMGGFMQQGIGW